MSPELKAWLWSIAGAIGIVILVLAWQACGCGR